MGPEQLRPSQASRTFPAGVHLRPLPALRRQGPSILPRASTGSRGGDAGQGGVGQLAPRPEVPTPPDGAAQGVRETPPDSHGGWGAGRASNCRTPAHTQLLMQGAPLNPRLPEKRRQVPRYRGSCIRREQRPRGRGTWRHDLPLSPPPQPRLPPSTQTPAGAPPCHSVFPSWRLTDSICSPADRLSQSSWKPQEGRGGQGKAPRQTGAEQGRGCTLDDPPGSCRPTKGAFHWI